MRDRGYWSEVLNRRLSRRRSLAVSGSAALAAGISAACGGDSGSKAPADPSGLLAQPVDEAKRVVRGGTLIGAGRRLTSLDPIGSSAIGINNRLYSQLWVKKAAYMEPYKGEMTGGIFESWEVSPDKLQITAKVTRKAHFVPDTPLNGREVDAHDVEYSWNRYKRIGAIRDEVVNEVNPSAPVLSMTALDDRTVSIRMSEPDATIFGLLGQERAGNFYVLPREAENIDIRNRSIGSGPWMIKEWAPGIGAFMKRNPGYGQDYRGENLPYIDESHYPELQESAVAIAQFRAGTTLIPTFVPREEFLPLKHDIPELLLYGDEAATTSMRIVMGNLPGSPLLDERVRVATMMTYDKDLAIDTLGATGDFEAAGIPVDKAYDSAMWINAPTGWWLDPMSKEFGPNGQNYRFDIAEAKKLLAAAGFPGGLDIVMNATFQYNPSILKTMDVILALFGGGHGGPVRYKINEIDYHTEWSPMIRFGRGKIDGFALLQDVDTPDPTLYMYARFHSKGGVFQGGDATTDRLLAQAKAEFDDDKRRELIHEVQRYEGKMMHFPLTHGGSSSFSIYWPAVRGIRVWQGGYNTDVTYWLDPTKPPFSKT